MGLHKGIATSRVMSKSFAHYSPEDRAAINQLIARERRVIALELSEVSAPVQSDGTAFLRMDSVAGPTEPGFYLVVDKDCGNLQYVYFDGRKRIFATGVTLSLTSFNMPAYQWFLLPKEL